MSEKNPWDFDPTTVSAGIEVLPKDDYEFQIGEPKSFLNAGKGGKADNFGIRFPLTVMRSANHPETVGKKIFMNGFMHTPGSQAMTKGFVMAGYGYESKPEDEKAFNEQTAAGDWKFNPPTGGVGDVWRGLTGKRIIGSLDQQPRKDDMGQVIEGEFNQNYKGWHPVSKGFKQEQG
jgi:hypothetical protein